MHTRLTTMKMQPDRIDDVISQLESEDVPRWKELDGFRGFLFLTDRDSGKVIGASFWDSEEQMLAAEDEVSPSRKRAAETGGATEPAAVERFEVAFDVFVRPGARG